MKEILRSLRDQFLYGGLSRSGFNEIRPRLDEENYYMAVRLSAAVVIIGLFMIPLTVFGYVRDYAMNAYLMLAAASAAVFLFLVSYVATHKTMAFPAMMAQLLILIIYAFLIGTVMTDSPNSYAVTYSAVIVLIPFLLTATPLPVCLLVLTGDLLVILITPLYKTPAATSMDIINAVTFSVIALLVQFVYSNRDMRRVASEQFISMDHDIDSLTGLQNETALRSMINTYLSRRLDGEEGAMILLRPDNCNDTDYAERLRERAVSVSGILRMMTSRYELIGRIGSETIAVFYRECSRADGERHYEKLTEAVRKDPACGAFRTAVVFTEAHDTFDTLYARGEDALEHSA